MADDGFGGSSKLPVMNDSAETEQLISLALQDTKLDDLQNMSEEQLAALLRKTMKNAAVADENDNNDNNFMMKKKDYDVYKIVLDNYKLSN